MNEQAALRVSTGMLNDVLSDAVTRVPAADRQGKKAENLLYDGIGREAADLRHLLQRRGAVPHFSYQRYLENKLREVFGFSGTPIRFVIREKGDDN